MSTPTASTTSTIAGADHGLRASDAEREDTVARLHRALGAGRLDLTETDIRIAVVWMLGCALLGASLVAW